MNKGLHLSNIVLVLPNLPGNIRLLKWVHHLFFLNSIVALRSRPMSLIHNFYHFPWWNVMRWWRHWRTVWRLHSLLVDRNWCSCEPNTLFTARVGPSQRRSFNRVSLNRDAAAHWTRAWNYFLNYICSSQLLPRPMRRVPQRRSSFVSYETTWSTRWFPRVLI